MQDFLPCSIIQEPQIRRPTLMRFSSGYTASHITQTTLMQATNDLGGHQTINLPHTDKTIISFWWQCFFMCDGIVFFFSFCHCREKYWVLKNFLPTLTKWPCIWVGAGRTRLEINNSRQAQAGAEISLLVAVNASRTTTTKNQNNKKQKQKTKQPQRQNPRT